MLRFRQLTRTLLLVIVIKTAGAEVLRCADFFFSPTCPYCAEVAPLVDAVAADPAFATVVVRHSIARAAEHKLLAEAFDAYGWTGARGVPTVFVCGLSAVIVGSKSIQARLNSTLLSMGDGGRDLCLCLEEDLYDGNSSSVSGAVEGLEAVTATLVAAVVAVGCAAALPPSALGLLSALLHGVSRSVRRRLTIVELAQLTYAPLRQQRERSFSALSSPPRPTLPEHSSLVLGAALLFSCTSFALYFSVAFALSVALLAADSAATWWTLKVVAGLALVVALFDIKSAYFHRLVDFNCDVPKRWLPHIESYFASVSSALAAVPAALVTSVAVLPYTAVPIVLTAALAAAESETLLGALLLCSIFGAIFVAPFIISALVLKSGSTTLEEVEAFRKSNVRTLFLIAAICLFAVGAMAIIDETATDVF